MSEAAELWQAVKAHRQQKRADNRAAAAGLLVSAGIQFEDKNGGAHLVVNALSRGLVDFWPGTGLWIPRNRPSLRRRGVMQLINFAKVA